MINSARGCHHSLSCKSILNRRMINNFCSTRGAGREFRLRRHGGPFTTRHPPPGEEDAETEILNNDRRRGRYDMVVLVLLVLVQVGRVLNNIFTPSKKHCCPTSPTSSRSSCAKGNHDEMVATTSFSSHSCCYSVSVGCLLCKNGRVVSEIGSASSSTSISTTTIMILEPQEELLLSFNFLLLLVHVSSSCSIALFFMLASSHDRGINHSVSTATPPHSMPRNSETIINPGGSHTSTSTASSKSKKSRTQVANCNHRTFATRKKTCRIEGTLFYKYSIMIAVLVAGAMATHVRAYSSPANIVTKGRNVRTTRRRGGPITTSTKQDQTSSFIDDTNSSSAILSDELANTYQDPHQHGATDGEPLLFTTSSSISSILLVVQRKQKSSSSIATTDITQEQQQNWKGENNYQQQEQQDQQGGNNDEKQQQDQLGDGQQQQGDGNHGLNPGTSITTTKQISLHTTQLFLTVFGYVIFGLLAFFMLGYLLNYFRIRIRSRSRSRRAQIVRQQQDRGTAQSSTNEVGESVVSQQQMVNIMTRSNMTSGSNVPGTSNRSIIQPTMAGVQHQCQDTLQEQGNSINTNTSSRSRDDIIGRNDFHDHQSQLSSSGGILAVNSIGPFVFPRGMLLQEEYDDNLSSDLETATAADEDLVSDSSRSSGRSCSSLNGEQRSNEAVLIS